jgi:RimJ/RimL family protein N-acetyltransferase
VTGTITLRPARFVDCLDVYRWNFAPEVRAQSNVQAAVALCDHSQWFSRRLRSRDPIWIIEEDRRAIGTVRLDNGRISIALAEAARGRSIGRKAIELACVKAGIAVTAEVAVTNLASQKCFEACGFTLQDRTADRFTYRWSA